MEKFFKLNVKLSAPVDIGALVSAIQYCQNVTWTVCHSSSQAVFSECLTDQGVLGVCCHNVNGVPP